MSGAGSMLVRRIVIQSVLAVLGISAVVYLTWALRALIVPLVVGVLLAYAIKPLIYGIARRGLPHGLAVAVVFATFAVVLGLVAMQIQSVWPDLQTRLELRIRLLYKLNQRYQALMGLDESLTKGNELYDRFGDDLDRFMWKVRDDLWFTEKELQAFLKARAGQFASHHISDRVYGYYLADAAVQEKAAARMLQLAGPGSASAISQTPSALGEILSRLAEILSLWIVMPITFLFVLVDQGEIRRALLAMIPNRYFEPALNVLADLDETVGSYLRGVIMECALVGISYMVLLWLVGVAPEWALLIGLFAGIVNIIPYGGSVLGLGMGLVYALLAEQVHSLLPFVTVSNLWVWIVVVALIVRVLDDAVFQPMVLGGALELHPLVVALGIIGASLLFGLSGAIFAVPTIALLEVFFRSTMRQLRAYSIV
ncbi:MAG TPA: AI-2E family transporter [Candidatus Solibacter sp.]|nr:AI-2E family transporter [Candidatus Solibacter sp.]